MAHYSHITINKHTFKVNTGTGDIDGIIIDPQTALLDDPSYMQELKILIGIYPIVEAHEQLVDTVACPPGELKDAPDSFLQDILRRWQTVKQGLNENTWYLIDIDPSVPEYVHACHLEYTRRQDVNRATRVIAERIKTAGYVYLLQSPTNAYKIGRTKNPKNRLETFSVKLPFEVEYVCVVQTEDMYGLEKDLHIHFSDKRINGEWFNLLPDDVEYIKGLANNG